MKPSSFVTAAVLAAMTVTAIGVAIPATAQETAPAEQAAPAQSPRTMRLFERFDTNGDGQITAEEIEADRATRFAAADTDGNGTLDAQELVAAVEAREDARALRRAERMVRRIDTNGDGVVSAEEMASVQAGRRGGGMFERLDANEDGVVTEDEVAGLADRMREGRGPRGEGRGHKGDHDRRGGWDRF